MSYIDGFVAAVPTAKKESRDYCFSDLKNIKFLFAFIPLVFSLFDCLADLNA